MIYVTNGVRTQWQNWVTGRFRIRKCIFAEHALVAPFVSLLSLIKVKLSVPFFTIFITIFITIFMQ